MRLSFLSLIFTLASTVLALTPAQWRTQSIYHLITDRFARSDGSMVASCDMNKQPYCGGTWRGIIKKLDYIQGMGFTAIWISPVTEQIEGMTPYGEAYHGYWQKNMYKLNKHFGTVQDLKALSKALHDRGMYLMVDVVTNHMAYPGAHDKVNYKSFTPFNDKSYFHSWCPINWGDFRTFNQCWMGDDKVTLPDLKTEDERVQSILDSWIKGLVSDYGIDGLRLDAAKHLSGYLARFQKAAGGIHTIGEIYTGSVADACSYQGPSGISGVMNFPAMYEITQAFQSPKGSMVNLAKNVYRLNKGCQDVTVLGSFIENQDLPRFASRTKDMSLAKNAIAYNILQDGIPIIYYGQEQHFSGRGDPFNREALWPSKYNTNAELYKLIKSVNTIRNFANKQRKTWATYWGVPTTWDQSTIVMRKGDLGYHTLGVFSNLGEKGRDYILPITYDNHFFGRNAWVIEITECKWYVTDKNANLNVKMSKGLPRVFYSAVQLKGTKICPNAWPKNRRSHVARHIHSHESSS